MSYYSEMVNKRYREELKEKKESIEELLQDCRLEDLELIETILDNLDEIQNAKYIIKEVISKL